MVKSYQNAIQSLWDGLCDVYIRETAVNKANGRDEATEVLWLHDEPCRLSFSTVTTTKEASEAAQTQQVVKLFLSKSAEIPPGSKLVVTQQGKTAAYVQSGVPATYSAHQEIVVTLFEDWA